MILFIVTPTSIITMYIALKWLRIGIPCYTLGILGYKRLAEHSESVKAAENLNITDFCCRFLVVDDIWIPLAESMLIERFKPVWNRVLDGFGNHDPGKGRHQGMMPQWDCLHPGRAWAARLQPCAITAEQLVKRVERYLSEYFSGLDITETI